MSNPILYSHKQIELLKIFGSQVEDKFINEELAARNEIDIITISTLILMSKSRTKYTSSVRTGVKLYLLYLKTKYPKLVSKWTCKEYIDIYTDLTLTTEYVKYPKQLFHEYKYWCELHPDSYKCIRDKCNEIKDTVYRRRQLTK